MPPSLPLAVGLSLALLTPGCRKKAETAARPLDGRVPERVEAASAYVDPFVGSGGFGFGFGSAFPGALAPQGLAKVGPDTRGPYGLVRFLHYSGYWYGDDTIQGFSHLHLHGTGAADYGVLTVMPLTELSSAHTEPSGYESPFQKTTERASPGFYGVRLENGPIDVELTARTHTAHHRYTFPEGAGKAVLLFDLDHHLDSGKVDFAEVTVFPAERRFRGRLHSLGEMSRGFGGYDVFFEGRTREGWIDSAVWSFGKDLKTGTHVAGEKAGFALTVAPTERKVALVVGLSLVSAEGAARNLETEIPSFDFDETLRTTEAEWEALLSAARVHGGTTAQRRVFYSSLYHAYLMPTVMSDADGRYRARDGSLRSAVGFKYCSDMSLWDTYRTLHPLYTLLSPDRAVWAVRSLHEMARAGNGFPRWPIATGDSGSMVGASADVVIAEAYVKGLTGFDAKDAYARLRAAALDPTLPREQRGGRSGIEPYLSLGYVPSSQGGSVSITTEFANDDFALSQMASALGETKDAEVLLARSRGYRKLFDPETGFLRPRDEKGQLVASGAFDPFFWGKEYVEANAWQSLWMTAHDAEGLVSLFGGQEKFVGRLTELFEKAKEELAAIRPDDLVTKSLPRPYYWHANEPDLNAAYLFAQAGRPDLTQKWARWVLDTFYSDKPDGLAGNDDGGTLSAWYVFSALGLYPLPGSDRYIVGAPLFPKVTLTVAAGVFTIEAEAPLTGDNRYVQSVELNGAPLLVPEIRHTDLKPGGALRFVMGPNPSSWGR